MTLNLAVQYVLKMQFVITEARNTGYDPFTLQKCEIVSDVTALGGRKPTEDAGRSTRTVWTVTWKPFWPFYNATSGNKAAVKRVLSAPCSGHCSDTEHPGGLWLPAATLSRTVMVQNGGLPHSILPPPYFSSLWINKHCHTLRSKLVVHSDGTANTGRLMGRNSQSLLWQGRVTVYCSYSNQHMPLHIHPNRQINLTSPTDETPTVKHNHITIPERYVYVMQRYCDITEYRKLDALQHLHPAGKQALMLPSGM